MRMHFVTTLLFLFLSTSFLCAEVREEKIEHAGAVFRVVRVEPDQLQLVWKDDQGQPYRTFDRVQAAYEKQGKMVRFIMNAGIFEPGEIPSGLHVEHAKELLPLNEKDGRGNFFLKPNGVASCWRGRDEGAYISTVEVWKRRTDEASRVRDYRAPQYAIQGGPLLLIGGKRHPAFIEGSPSRLVRNGVGVDSKGRFIFAITDQGQVVNFWDFAGLFLKLDCQDALFLDGTISQCAVNPTRPMGSNAFAAMFVVAE